MGYYTRYELEILEGDDNVTDYEHELSMSTGYGASVFDDEIKWYDWLKDITKYSLSHPSVLFLISGEGEENGDIWRCYVKSGLHQYTKAKMSFDEYDESKLTSK
jgi:hypothetical protein